MLMRNFVVIDAIVPNINIDCMRFFESAEGNQNFVLQGTEQARREFPTLCSCFNYIDMYS